MEPEPSKPATAPEPRPGEAVPSPPQPQGWDFKSLLRRRSVWVIGGLLAVGIGVLGYEWAFGKPKVHYATAEVARGDIESTVVAAGIVQPVKYVDVGAQTSGMLKSLKVIRGDQVQENDLLAEIDPALADTALTSATAALANMTALRAVKQAQLTLTGQERARNDRLFEAQLISANDRDIAQAGYDAAFADAASLSAQMRQASAAIATARTNLGYTKITAPMAGEVVSISLLEGQTLNANQSAPNILRIANMTTVTVWAQVSEADIVRVRVDQEVYFTVLGSPRRWNGKVRQILPTPELINNVVFYDVLFDIPNAEHQLQIQMTAQVFIVLAEAKGVLLIPASAVGNASEGAQAKVRVLKPDGAVEVRTIRLGIKSEILAEVKEGLLEKERIITGETTAKGKTTSALSARKGP